jgi:Holliday junction resolvase RusA-like endonuclease
VSATAQDPLFVGLPAERDVVARFTIPGEPVSKARARFTKYGSRVQTYTPQRTRDAESAVALQYRAAGGALCPDALQGFGVAAIFYNGTRQRRDVDNMLKLILDGLNGVAWVDDLQVTEVAGSKRFLDDRDAAHTDVVVYRTDTLLRRERPCGECGTALTTYPSWGRSGARYCSPPCREAAKAKKREEARRARGERPVVCQECGATFHSAASKPPRFCSKACTAAGGRIDIACGVCGQTFSQARSLVARGQIYCSAVCRATHAREVQRERRSLRMRGTCSICGAGTTRPEYRRCNPCKLAGLVAPGVRP